MMTKTMSVSARILCASVGLGGLASLASAAQINYVFSGIGSGSIDGHPFASKFFAITATADTANIVDTLSSHIVTHTTASISITGVGIYTFLTTTSTAVNFDLDIAVFGNIDAGLALIRTSSNPAFDTYDLASDFGPVLGGGDFLQWEDQPVSTSGGTLVFTAGELGFGSFAAAIVPGPGALGVLALAGLPMVRRRR